MITDVILKLFSSIYQFVIGLLPSFTFIENLVNAKDQFIQFISTFVSYSLYLFNVPVLRFTLTLLVLYITFLSGEYLLKLGTKYITNLF